MKIVRNDGGSRQQLPKFIDIESYVKLAMKIYATNCKYMQIFAYTKALSQR